MAFQSWGEQQPVRLQQPSIQVHLRSPFLGLAVRFLERGKILLPKKQELADVCTSMYETLLWVRDVYAFISHTRQSDRGSDKSVAL
jgi:hypothetical protein